MHDSMRNEYRGAYSVLKNDTGSSQTYLLTRVGYRAHAELYIFINDEDTILLEIMNSVVEEKISTKAYSNLIYVKKDGTYVYVYLTGSYSKIATKTNVYYDNSSNTGYLAKTSDSLSSATVLPIYSKSKTESSVGDHETTGILEILSKKNEQFTYSSLLGSNYVPTTISTSWTENAQNIDVPGMVEFHGEISKFGSFAENFMVHNDVETDSGASTETTRYVNKTTNDLESEEKSSYPAYYDEYDILRLYIHHVLVADRTYNAVNDGYIQNA